VRVIINGIELVDEKLVRMREQRDGARREAAQLRDCLDAALLSGYEAARERDALARSLLDLREQQFTSRVRALPRELITLSYRDPALHCLVHAFAASSILPLRWLRERYVEQARAVLEELVDENALSLWLCLFPAESVDDLFAIITTHGIVRAARDYYQRRFLLSVPTRWTLMRSTSGVDG
jgi:hypothetical protein